MPFVDGESLRARLERDGELPVAEAVRILRDVASALAYAHDARRRPSRHQAGQHAALRRRGGGHRLRRREGADVVDDRWRVARSPRSASRSEHPRTWRPSRPPPTRERIIARTSTPWVFSRYEILTGATPFAGRVSQAILAAQVQEEPENIAKRRATLPPPLAALIMRCLAKRPADRPQHASELVRALDEMVTPSAGSVPPLQFSNSRVETGRRWSIAIGAILVIALGLFASRRFGAQRAVPRSIAVLPFENKSGDTSYDYLAEGMSDEVRSQLTKVTGLAVMARSSSMALKSQSTDVRDVGAKLKVASILQGSVSRAGGRLHVTAEVVRTDDGTAVWSETFDQDADHLSTIRDSVTRAVTAALRLSVGTRPARVEDPVARD